VGPKEVALAILDVGSDDATAPQMQRDPQLAAYRTRRRSTPRTSWRGVPVPGASLCTSFYDKCPILKAETPEQVDNRLFLCDVAACTLHEGMALLGIRTPEHL
jgi:hypothetical protein